MKKNRKKGNNSERREHYPLIDDLAFLAFFFPNEICDYESYLGEQRKHMENNATQHTK